MVMGTTAMPIEKDHDLLHAVGTRLQRIRKARGYTQQQLAEHLGVEIPTLSRYENGERPISLSLLSRAAAFLEVRPVDFLEVEEAAGQEGAHDEAAVLELWRLLDGPRRELALRLLREVAKTSSRDD